MKVTYLDMAAHHRTGGDGGSLNVRPSRPDVTLS